MLNTTNLQAIADAFGGLVVRCAIPGSPSALAGVRYGDIVLEVDGKPTPTLDAYLGARRACGDVFPVKLLRNDQTLEFTLDCTAAPLDFSPELVDRLRALRAFGTE